MMKKRFQIIALFSLLGALTAAPVWAQPVSVEASLSQPTAGVGEPVQLTISVTGTRNARVPDNFALPGLPIVGRTQSTQINIINFQMTSTVNYVFTMVPHQEGTFNIPALAIEAGGQVYRTQPLTLEVRGAATLPPPGAAPGAGGGNVFRPGVPPATAATPPPTQQAGIPIDQIARMELIVPATEVFVGQVVPVEMRLYFDQRFQFELGNMPEFSGEGFVTQRLSDPIQRSQVIDGVPYEIIIFHSSITPVKSGALTIEPARMTCNVIVPGGRGGMGSIFDDFFGGDPFGGVFGERRQIELQSDSVQLQAQALPRDNRPADFTGAIGQFSMTQRISSGTAEVGEPMTLSVDISGQGNFPAITPPALVDTEGWRTYTGSDEFRSSDSVGFSGTKQFDITVMPLQETDRTPVAQFSFFDPVEKRFITLRGEPQPVLVRGGSAPAAPAPTPSVAVAADPTPDAASPDAAMDETVMAETTPVILEPMREAQPGSFVSLPLRPEFLVANGAALTALLALAGVVLLRRRAVALPARVQKLRHTQKQLLNRLENPALEPLEFYSGAAEFIQNQGRIHARDPETPIAERTILDNPLLTPEVRDELQRVLDWHDEIRFSSRPQNPGKLQRESALAALQALRRQMP